MAKHLLKAWLIGLIISLVSVGIVEVAHTPFAFVVGKTLCMPMLPVFFGFIEIARWMAVSDATWIVALPITLVVGGSLIYGALILAILRFRDRKRTEAR